MVAETRQVICKSEKDQTETEADRRATAYLKGIVLCLTYFTQCDSL